MKYHGHSSWISELECPWQQSIDQVDPPEDIDRPDFPWRSQD